MHKTSISLVSYWNTRPFLFGLQKSGLTEFFEVFLDTPSAGGKRLMNNEVDIALAPVITLNSMADARLLTHYCIGAAGSVRTVCLFSHEPPETLRKVYLDAHSLTSVRLIRIIYSLNNWSEPEWISADVHPGMLQSGEGALVIGDKSFPWHGQYPYVLDLAEEWIRLTDTDFVFAAWITRKERDEELEIKLNDAFETGLQHLKEVAELVSVEGLSAADLFTYYTRHISYCLDDRKKAGMELYLRHAAELPLL